MLYAFDGREKRLPTGTGDRATCPGCGDEVLAKCGKIVAHHWAHRVDGDCVVGLETEWHRSWKRFVHPSCCEVSMVRDGKTRFADIQLADGRVIELQHGRLSVEEIVAREDFYVFGLWVYDGRSIGWEEKRIHIGRRGGFWWKRGPKSLTFHRWPIWIDTGEELKVVSLALVNGGSRVVGRFFRDVSYTEFFKTLRSGGVEADVPLPWKTGRDSREKLGPVPPPAPPRVDFSGGRLRIRLENL